MKKKLSIRAKIALPIVFLPFLGLLIAFAALALIIWIIQLVLTFTGIGESILFLFDLSKKGLKRQEFRKKYFQSEKEIQSRNKFKN